MRNRREFSTSPFQKQDGTIIERTSGTPQGGVISPVLANLFLHYVFDDFMVKECKTMQWERYADDAVVHCWTKKQAIWLKDRLMKRFESFGLELNLEKTKIVYCGRLYSDKRQENKSFDFLGYTFRRRGCKTKKGTIITGFTPAVSGKAKKAMRIEIRSWKLQLKQGKSLGELAEMYNPVIQGWINYYAHFYKSELYDVLRYINKCLVKWVRRTYKKRNTISRAEHWLGRIAQRDNNLFAHWRFGIRPAAG